MPHPFPGTTTDAIDTRVVEDAIVRALAYVDMFDYPLRPVEIHRFLERVPATIERVVQLLVESRRMRRFVRRESGYYMLEGRQEIAQIRRRREAISRSVWPVAVRYGQLLAAAPFVRMVAVTGSLAVNNADEGADIDYLLITANDRLWLCRAFVILVVRLAARRSVSLCPNYLLTERALLIGEQNLYTAHELVQMMPLSGMKLFHGLRRANKWAYDYLPNATLAPAASPPLTPDGHGGRLRRLRPAAEQVLNTRPGRALERWEMERKIARFEQHENGGQQARQEAQFSANWCKGHFDGHATAILDAYTRRLEALELAP